MLDEVVMVNVPVVLPAGMVKELGNVMVLV
jgi:hypothetical protein